jgi:DNA polymerase III subunit delta
MADLAPAYLVHGDDDVKLDSWRTRARTRAEEDEGATLESLDARSTSPEDLAASLASLTFTTGDRWLLVDGVESWKAAALAPLEEGLKQPAPQTVLVLIGRGKVQQKLVKAVEAAGGEVRACPAPKPWELPKWAVEYAGELGLQLDSAAAKLLVDVAGGGQQRVSRELEKLAIAVHPGTRAGVEEIQTYAAGDASPQVYDLADAVAARDLNAALALAEELRAQDERPGRVVYPVVRRLRDVHRAAELLDEGVSESAAVKELSMPPWAAKKAIARAKSADRESLERALCVFADLEVELRGEGPLRGIDEDSALSLALERAAG